MENKEEVWFSDWEPVGDGECQVYSEPDYLDNMEDMVERMTY